MGEQWGLSVKLFGKTILVVPATATAKGADATPLQPSSEQGGGGCSGAGEADELLKDARSSPSSSPVLTKCIEVEKGIAGRSESESPEPKPETGMEAGDEETEDAEQEELQFPEHEEKQVGDDEPPNSEASVTEAVTTGGEKEEEGEKKTPVTTDKGNNKKKPAEKPDKNKILPCPRCKSEDTKFCYYNNYNVNQPRHFCRNCQRYWTAGGTMRNVPVGAGRRKSKSVVAEVNNNSLYVFMLRQQPQQQQQGYITAEAAALPQPIINTSRASTVLSFSPNNPVACVAPVVGHGSSTNQTAGVVLVYSPTATASPTTPNTKSAVATNQFVPPYCNNFTHDQKKGELCYRDQGTMNVTNPPVCAVKYEPWMLPPTSAAELVPTWRQQPMHLGKHVRDGENNVKCDVKQRRHDEQGDEDRRSKNIWAPKALRITDSPDAAANSSIWTTISASGLGFNKKDHHSHCANKMASSSAMERGFFNAFHTKEKQVNATAPASTTRANEDKGAILCANPAALARSHQFQETV